MSWHGIKFLDDATNFIAKPFLKKDFWLASSGFLKTYNKQIFLLNQPIFFNYLSRFMRLTYFYTPWKHLIFLGGAEREQWQEMG